MRKHLGIAVAAVTFAAVLLPSSASAQAVRLHDQADDYPAYLDLTRASITNGLHRLSMTVHVRDLRRGRTGLVVTVDTGKRGGSGYLLQSFGAVDGYFTTLYRFRRPGGAYQEVRCRNLSGHEYAGALNEYKAGIPQRCLGDDAGTVRMRVTIHKAESSRRDLLTPVPVLRRD